MFVKEAAYNSFLSLCANAATRHQGECSDDVQELIGIGFEDSFDYCMLQREFLQSS